MQNYFVPKLNGIPHCDSLFSGAFVWEDWLFREMLF